MARKKRMRHENGFGSIVKLSGERRKPYGVRITVGWEDGKQVRKYLGYYRTEKEALIALSEYHKGNYDIDLSKLTLNDMYERWFKRIDGTISDGLLRAHNMAYTRFGDLGKRPFTKIKADHLQDWMDNIDLSPGSKKRVKSTLIQIWKYGIKNDIVQNNYAEHIVLREKVESSGSIFTDDEIKLLWENADKQIVRWVLILMYTGMRIGEMLAMPNESINLEERYMIGGSKTEAGRDRVIPIHDKILPLVKQEMGDTKYLIGSKDNALAYQGVKGRFDNLMKKYNMDHNPHDTRKTAVSLMHGANIPMETIRIIVGHSGKGITEQVYLRKTPQELVDEINKIEIL